MIYKLPVRTAYAEAGSESVLAVMEPIVELGGNCYDSFPVIRRGRARDGPGVREPDEGHI